MNVKDIIIWIILIYIADMAAAATREWWQKRKRPDLRCDICEKIIHPRFIKKTFDKKFWACTKCREIYLADRKAQTNEQKE